MSTPAIETIDLRKTFTIPVKQPGIWGGIRGLIGREKKEIEAVKGVNLRIENGEIVGFLGPNGAGKTTTIKILSGILFPTSGEARVMGFKPFERKAAMLRQISLVMGNKNQLWWDLPAWDSFLVLKELYDVTDHDFKKRVDFLVESLDLAEKVNTQVRKMSLGERMKCELVAALIHSPKVLFLDEPTIGLDVISQKRIRDFLRELNRTEGATILLTSHYMQDVRELCERVIVIDHGTTVFDGTLDTLTDNFSDTRRLRLAFSSPVNSAQFAKYGQIIEQDTDSVVVEIPRDRTPAITAEILGQFPVKDIAVEDVSIEDVIRDLFTPDAVELPGLVAEPDR